MSIFNFFFRNAYDIIFKLTFSVCDKLGKFFDMFNKKK